MSGPWIALFGVVGLFVGAATWVIARNQAGHRPLLTGSLCEEGEGAPGLAGWLPLLGFGQARRCTGGTSGKARRRVGYELVVAAYWAIAAWRIDDWRSLLSVLVFTAPLLVILLVDAWTRLIHVDTIAAGTLLGLAFAGIGGVDELLSSALGLVVGAAIFAFFFGLAMLIYRNPKVVPFGLGDVYLAAMIGAMVTFDEVVRALVYGIFLAGFCIALLLVLKRVNRKQAVPYGPFLVAGALLTLLL